MNSSLYVGHESPIILFTILSKQARIMWICKRPAALLLVGWRMELNNNGGQIPAPFSDEQISESLSTSDHEACASPGKSQTQVRRGRRRGRRGEMCPSLAHSPLQGTEQCQQQLNGKLGDGNTDSSTESFKSPIPGSQQPSGKVPAWQDRAES